MNQQPSKNHHLSASLLKEMREQLTDNEALTTDMNDESAMIILKWGEQKINRAFASVKNDDELIQFVKNLREMISMINHFSASRAVMSEEEFVTHIIKLLDTYSNLKIQKSIKNKL